MADRRRYPRDGGDYDRPYRSRNGGPERYGGGGGSRYSGGGRGGGRRDFARDTRPKEEVSESRVLGVFNLTQSTTEGELKKIFEDYGPVEKVVVIYDAHTNRSRGFSFVYFEDIGDAIAAKDGLSGTQIDGRDIRLDFSMTQKAHSPTPGTYMGGPEDRRHDKPNGHRTSSKDDYVSSTVDGEPLPGKVLGLFGLNTKTDEKHLESLLSKHGTLEKCLVVRDGMSGNSRGFAFAYFTSIVDAKNAKESLNGQDIDGRVIRVDFSFTQSAHNPTPGAYMGKDSQRSSTRYNPYDKPIRSEGYSGRGRGGGGFSSRGRGGGGGGYRSSTPPYSSRYGGERSFGGDRRERPGPYSSSSGRRSYRERSVSPRQDELFDAFKKIYPLLMKMRR